MHTWGGACPPRLKGSTHKGRTIGGEPPKRRARRAPQQLQLTFVRGM
jgi:hypothetical protein